MTVPLRASALLSRLVVLALGSAAASGCAWGYRAGLDTLGSTRGQAQVLASASGYGGIGSTTRYVTRPRSSGVLLAGTLTAGIDLPAATPTLRGTGGFMGFSVPESPGQLVGYQITFEGGPGGRGEGLGQVEVSYVLRGGPLFRLRTREHREALWLLGVDLVGNATLALDGTSAFNASIGIGVSLMWLHVQPFHL